nr:hypothetical protein [Banana bunchy top virus]
MTEGQGNRSTLFWLAQQDTRIKFLIRRTRGRTEILLHLYKYPNPVKDNCSLSSVKVVVLRRKYRQRRSSERCASREAGKQTTKHISGIYRLIAQLEVYTVQILYFVIYEEFRI